MVYLSSGATLKTIAVSHGRRWSKAIMAITDAPENTSFENTSIPVAFIRQFKEPVDTIRPSFDSDRAVTRSA